MFLVSVQQVLDTIYGISNPTNYSNWRYIMLLSSVRVKWFVVQRKTILYREQQVLDIFFFITLC